MSNEAAMQVHRFWKTYEKETREGFDPATMREVHFVEYGPVGNKSRTTNIAKVSTLIDHLLPLEGSTDNAVAIAHMRADFIRKHYESWLKGQDTPVDGTPLAAWNALSPEQAEAVRLQGIRTIEEIAALTETTASRMPFPNKSDLIRLAKNFVESKDQTRLAAALTKKDEEIANLKLENEERDQREKALAQKLDELAAIVAAQEQAAPSEEAPQARKPGRPRKETVAA